VLYRQGDVLIEQVDDGTVKGEKMQPRDGRVILAYGEATGHHHSIAVEDVALAVEDDGVMFLKTIRDSVVSHQEHDPISIPAGTYRVTRQREYSPDEIRNVAD
jgi:hypothetical protein